MILDISNSEFKNLFEDKKLFLPIRWDGYDFLHTLNGLFDYYIKKLDLLPDDGHYIRVDTKVVKRACGLLGELDRLFIKIYEDNAKGKLNDDRFAMMSKTYEDEQAQLKSEIVNLQKEIEVQERQIEDLEQFIQQARRYTDLTELTPYALRELVKAVYVEAPDKSSGKRKQRVHIEYDLVGYIPVDELIKAEQA